MSFGIALLCVCLGAYLALYAGVRLYARLYSGFFLHHKEWVEGIAVYLALLFGMGVLSALSFVPLNVVIFGSFAGLGILVLKHLRLPKKWTIPCQDLLCFVGIFSLYDFELNAFWVPFLLAFLWVVMWQVIVWFDRFLLTSLIVSVGWAIGLVSTGLLLHTLPDTVIAMACLLGVMTLVLGAFRASQKQTDLGSISSSLLGFMWAGVWVYFLNYGALIQTCAAFGYYIFEFIFLLVVFFAHKPLQTILERLVSCSPFGSKAVKIIFSHVLILSFLAAMTIRLHQAINSVLIFAIAVVLLDLYLRLKGLENPVPTWRELFKETRQGVANFVNQMKQAKKTVEGETVKPKLMKQKTSVNVKLKNKRIVRKKTSPKLVNKKVGAKQGTLKRKKKK